MRSSPGRALRAIGDSEVASELLGLHTADWKLRVFTLSGAYAGLAGALYANYVTFLSPQPFGFIFSLYFTYVQAFVLRAFCTWCVISALNFTLMMLAVYLL